MLHDTPKEPRKFKFARPKNAEERAEAAYEEIAETSGNDRNLHLDTLKDYVIALHKEFVQWRHERQDERNAPQTAEYWALCLLAVLAIGLLFLSGTQSDYSWLEKHRFLIRMLGIVLAGIYVGVSIERSSFFEKLWRFGFVKFVASIVFSTIVVISTAKASIAINGVFGIDAGAFPFTRTIVAGIMFFNYISPMMLWLVGLFVLGHALIAYGWFKSKLSDDDYSLAPVPSFFFLLLALIFLGVAHFWLHRDFDSKNLPEKIYRLAHELDFSPKHQCAGLPQGIAVVFIGTNQSKVLFDRRSIGIENIESFVRQAPIGIEMVPDRFQVMPCTQNSMQPEVANP